VIVPRVLGFPGNMYKYVREGTSPFGGLVVMCAPSKTCKKPCSVLFVQFVKLVKSWAGDISNSTVGTLTIE
jgi:hypothetical protein